MSSSLNESLNWNLKKQATVIKGKNQTAEKKFVANFIEIPPMLGIISQARQYLLITDDFPWERWSEFSMAKFFPLMVQQSVWNKKMKTAKGEKQSLLSKRISAVTVICLCATYKLYTLTQAFLTLAKWCPHTCLDLYLPNFVPGTFLPGDILDTKLKQAFSDLL